MSQFWKVPQENLLGACIAEQGNAFALVEMCDVLAVRISDYRARRQGGKADR